MITKGVFLFLEVPYEPCQLGFSLFLLSAYSYIRFRTQEEQNEFQNKFGMSIKHYFYIFNIFRHKLQENFDMFNEHNCDNKLSKDKGEIYVPNYNLFIGFINNEKAYKSRRSYLDSLFVVWGQWKGAKISEKSFSFFVDYIDKYFVHRV